MKNVILFFLLLTSDFTLSQEVEMITDWNEAKELAFKTEKKILIILTGSEWCAPCKKMDKNLIANPEFQSYAEKNLVVFLIDLPGGGLHMNSEVFKNYNKFKNKYQAKYMPSLVLTEKDGAKIKTLTGKMFRLENVMEQLRAN